MKKILSLFIAAVIMIGMLSGCGDTGKAAEAGPSQTSTDAGKREFTDDTGRTVSLPSEVHSIAVSGPLSQIYVISIAADLMVGSANYFSSDAEKYLLPELLALPQLGQLYGGKGTMDLEALLSAAPDVVIDIGEAKGNIKEDFDALTEQTGIPFVHIDATVETAPDAYRRLGELLGRGTQAEELALYLESILNDVTSIMGKVDADGKRKNIVYCLGDKGLNVLADGSFHADTIRFVANNIAEVPDVVSSGNGNEIDMEQLMIWNPEAIVFAPESVYESVGSDPSWQHLDAIKSGKYYETPVGPYGWLQSPPAVQRYLGLMWLCSILYPEYCTYDLQSKVTEYYKIFYSYDLSGEDYSLLTANAFGPVK